MICMPGTARALPGSRSRDLQPPPNQPCRAGDVAGARGRLNEPRRGQTASCTKSDDTRVTYSDGSASTSRSTITTGCPCPALPRTSSQPLVTTGARMMASTSPCAIQALMAAIWFSCSCCASGEQKVNATSLGFRLNRVGEGGAPGARADLREANRQARRCRHPARTRRGGKGEHEHDQQEPLCLPHVNAPSTVSLKRET